MLPLLIGKTFLFLLLTIKGSAGSTWPGHIALKIDKYFIRRIVSKNPHLKIVFVAGTNGKTTTTKALKHILEANLIQVITNETGANLENGLASILIKNVNLYSKTQKNALIFEVDENSLPKILNQIPNPNAIVLLNLFRDQLDRYGEVNIVAEKWKKVLEKLSSETLVIANADDPKVAFITSFAKQKAYFTINNKLKSEIALTHAVDSSFCPKCGKKLSYSNISYSHIGNFYCTSCSFKNPNASIYDFKTELSGSFNTYNLSAALLASEKVFHTKNDISEKSLIHFKPAFGRQEVIEAENNKKITIFLAKNPTGFNESLKIAVEKSSNFLILLNDNISDGRDISWIWDIDLAVLKSSNVKIILGGTRCFDLQNRFFYSDITSEVSPNLQMAYQKALSQTPQNQTLAILPTYSAMLQVRKLIKGKSIL